MPKSKINLINTYLEAAKHNGLTVPEARQLLADKTKRPKLAEYKYFWEYTSGRTALTPEMTDFMIGYSLEYLWPIGPTLKQLKNKLKTSKK